MYPFSLLPYLFSLHLQFVFIFFFFDLPGGELKRPRKKGELSFCFRLPPWTQFFSQHCKIPNGKTFSFLPILIKSPVNLNFFSRRRLEKEEEKETERWVFFLFLIPLAHFHFDILILTLFFFFYFCNIVTDLLVNSSWNCSIIAERRKKKKKRHVRKRKRRESE